MKYMLMIYADNGARGDLSAEEQQALHREYMAVSDDPAVKGDNRLQPALAATTVRVQDGQTLTTDGPFVEIKEELGGYYLVDVDDLDAAIEIAARIPAARHGAIEIRPVMEQ